MRFMVVGINHETAPVEIRERVSISDIALDDVLLMLRNARTVLESVVLSTCNRTELYCVVSSERAGSDYLSSVLARVANESVDKLKSYLYVKSGQEAVHHLFRVVCGLDSMILGETQILGQVRSAYLTAAEEGNLGALLNYCFRLAVQTGKKAQSQTVIGQSPVSVSYAAVQLAKKIVGDLRDRRVLLIGAGKMSALTLQHVSASGALHVTVVNRSWERAEQLAKHHGAYAASWERLEDELASADVIVASTGARDYVLTADMVARAQRRRSYRPMVVIDISVPRNVEPEVQQVRHTYHFDIDDLNGVIAANLEERRRATDEVEHLIAAAMSDFADWLAAQSVVPVIAAIRQKGTDVQSSVMESLRRKLPNISEREFSLIHKHTMSIVNQLLRDPILYMKEQAIASGGSRQVEGFAKLFGVEEALASPGPLDMLDGYKSESSGDGLAGLAEALRAWRAALFSEESSETEVRGQETSLHQAAR